MNFISEEQIADIKSKVETLTNAISTIIVATNELNREQTLLIAQEAKVKEEAAENAKESIRLKAENEKLATDKAQVSDQLRGILASEESYRRKKMTFEDEVKQFNAKCEVREKKITEDEQAVRIKREALKDIEQREIAVATKWQDIEEQTKLNEKEKAIDRERKTQLDAWEKRLQAEQERLQRIMNA